MAEKESPPDLEHLKWLVEKRCECQKASLRLYNLLKTHPEKIRNDRGLMVASQALIAACFSFWRSVFLADKEGNLEITQTAAEGFLAKLILDNAINYVQDRDAREWTFNYYLNSAVTRLRRVSQLGFLPNTKVATLPEKYGPKGEWEHYHRLLSEAISEFAKHLEALPSPSA